jgi:hypothetical protein
MKIINADQRLEEKSGAKILIVGLAPPRPARLGRIMAGATRGDARTLLRSLPGSSVAVAFFDPSIAVCSID